MLWPLAALYALCSMLYMLYMLYALYFLLYIGSMLYAMLPMILHQAQYDTRIGQRTRTILLFGLQRKSAKVARLVVVVHIYMYFLVNHYH